MEGLAQGLAEKEGITGADVVEIVGRSTAAVRPRPAAVGGTRGAR